jgi:hypothetical protein
MYEIDKKIKLLDNIKKDEVVLMSRNGKELVNFVHINSQFDDMLGELDQSWVFDGEIMSADFWSPYEKEANFKKEN